MALRVIGLVGALTIVASGVVHLYLWGHTDGYRAVPTIGALFLVQAIIGCLLGLVVAVVSHPLTPAGGAAYMAASVAGLLVSIRWGLFGSHVLACGRTARPCDHARRHRVGVEDPSDAAQDPAIGGLTL